MVVPFVPHTLAVAPVPPVEVPGVVVPLPVSVVVPGSVSAPPPVPVLASPPVESTTGSSLGPQAYSPTKGANKTNMATRGAFDFT